jgi:transcriptional regulator with XRE-family HTH domain
MDALPCCHPALIARKPKDSAYPTELETVGDPVRARRLHLGLYQRDVAKRIGVTTDTITNWRKNRSNPTLRSWPSVIGFLGYDPRPAGLTIGEQLCRHRQGLGLSRAEAARIMGVDPSTLSTWELGERVPQGRYLRAVWRFLREN